MIRSKTSGGVEVSWSAIHRSPEGELISAQRKRGRWFQYFFGNWDTLRVAYCELHRHDSLPDEFRAGSFSIKMIIYFLKLKYRGEFIGLQVS